jgi:hypothetical protein
VNRDLKKAYALYSEFRESTPRRGRRIEFDIPKAVMVMGHITSISYVTTLGRKAVNFTHDFHDGSRPALCAGAEPNQLFIIEGRYIVTDRGIVDLDSQGNELDD